MTSSADPVSAVRQYIDGFNKGDVNAMAAMCADPMSILDGMAPHVWHGPTACQDWYREVLVEGEHAGAKDYQVTLGKPLHADVTGDAAYAVIPATMKLKVHGKQVTQSGAAFTVALRRVAHRQLGLGQRHRLGFIDVAMPGCFRETLHDENPRPKAALGRRGSREQWW